MGDKQRCPCCKTSEDCPYLQNVNIKSAGLIIYRYSTCVKDLNSYTERKESSTEIFILHNTKNVDIASEKLIPKLVQYKKCPRCKYILENAEKLLRNIPVINKLDVLGICDKCRAKDRKDISSCECSEVIKKFISIKESEKIEFRKNKWRESQLQKLFNRFVNKDEESKSNARNKSESIENICHVFKQKREPQVGHIIEAKKKLRVTSKLQQGKIPFSKTIQKIRFTREHYSDTELREINAEITNSGSNIKLQKPFHSHDKNNLTKYGATYFQSLGKKSKEYPLRGISISEESFYLNFHDLIDKAAKLNSKRPPTHVQTALKFNKNNEPSILDLIAEKNCHRKDNDKKETQDFDTKRISVVSEVGTDILKTKLDTISSPDTISKYKSDEAFSATLLTKTKELLQKDFSYFFIKEAELKSKLMQTHKSSSELIKDTQDMLLAREKDIKKIYNEKFKRTLDETEQKRKALEEKIRRLKENKTLLEKDKENKKLEEIKKQIHEEREIKVSDKMDISTKETRSMEKESKDIRATSEKSKKSDIKAEPKFKHVKQEKEANLRLEKERKMKEKEKLKMEEKEPSRKEKQGKDKQKSIDEKVKEGPSEKIIQHSKTEKAISAKVKENQPARDNEMREPKKDGIPKRDIQKLNKEKEEEPKIEERRDDNFKKVIEKRHKEPSEIEAEKTKIHSADMKKAKEDAALKLKALREMEREIQHQQPKPEKKIEETKIKELNINQIKMRPPSQDNLIFQLVKLKQIDGGNKTDRPRKISEIHIPLTLIASHNMEHKCIKFATCAICNDSELELDIDEIIFEKAARMDINDIIIGQKILKYKHPLIEKSEGKHKFPIFMTTFNDDLPFSRNGGPINADENIPGQLDRKPPPVSGKYAEKEPPKGVIRYALSDRTFIEKGWTMLPTEKVVRKMNVYRMRPAHPEFDWFEHNKNKKIMQYDSGEKLAEFDDNGRGRLYYRNGRLALDYYNAEEINAQQRFVIHSSGELDARGCSRPLAILATFDYLGNGIVFDHTGKIRLKYNQTEGVVLDRSIGPVSHWKWHTLNDPPVLQQVMIDTQMAHKDPDILKLGGPVETKTRPDNEEMLAIEFDNFIKEKSKKLSQKFKPFQIKMKALKINEHFSLRVLDQATIYLIFRDGSTNLKINLGMILDHQEIVDTDTAEVGEVSNSLERFPARTDSLAGLQNSVAFAQRIERARIERERRLRPTQPCSSSDKLTAAASRPLRAPLRTVASESTVATCRCRKPTLNNVYYDTRLI